MEKKCYIKSLKQRETHTKTKAVIYDVKTKTKKTINGKKNILHKVMIKDTAMEMTSKRLAILRLVLGSTRKFLNIIG